MAARGDPCSNWCTFATWASRQAGRTIRGEDLLGALEHELGRDAELLHPVDAFWRALVRRGLFRRDTALGRLVTDLHTPFDAFELASDAVARGNRKVFAEIGLQFARYLHDCDADCAPTRRRSRPSSTGWHRATRPMGSATCAWPSPATSSSASSPTESARRARRPGQSRDRAARADAAATRDR